MSREVTDRLETLLQNVPTGRRYVLKRLLAGAGTLALLLPSTTVLAQEPEARRRPGPGQGNGTGKGRGRGKGDGTGKGGRGQGKGGSGRGKGTPPAA